MDFSDPQGGKGSADGKLAQVKCHVKAFINQGNSVTTEKEFEKGVSQEVVLKESELL